MSNLNQELIFPVKLAAAPRRSRLLSRIAGWLRRFWQSECRRAERPDRVVPYY
jgi:hypothetical protein